MIVKHFFQEMSGRTLSLPRKHDYEGEVGDGFHKSSQKRTRSRQNLHANGTFSLHGTLRRNHSNGQFNTTLEDDVFEDSISAPNSAKPLLHENAAKNQTQYFPHLYNISHYGMCIKYKLLRHTLQITDNRDNRNP